MAGHFIDVYRKRFFGSKPVLTENVQMLSTSYGKIRTFDSGGNKPVILNVPDGPNVIEHQENLIEGLAKNFRVICFELPGVGFSYPTSDYDYSIQTATALIVEVMDIKSINEATVLVSCSNGFYGIKLAELHPDRVTRLFLAQTPSLASMIPWTAKSIPDILVKPVVGQFLNALTEKKLAETWYKIALPKSTDKSPFTDIAVSTIKKGGCFCLSGLVQGLMKEEHSILKVKDIPTTLVWGDKDFSHRKTDFDTIREHIPNCELIRFEGCGHFPELENTKDFVRLVEERSM